MAFLSSDGQIFDAVAMDASLLRDELEGVDIRVAAGPTGTLTAAFVGDVSWMDADPQALCREAVALVKADAIAKGWWSGFTGPGGEAIVGWQ